MKYTPPLSDSWGCGGKAAFLVADDGDAVPERRMQVTGLSEDAVRYPVDGVEALLQPGFDWDREGKIRLFSRPRSARSRMGLLSNESTDDILLPDGSILEEDT